MRENQMTVKAMIEALSKLDPDAPVWYEGDAGYAPSMGVEPLQHPYENCHGVFIY